ncbi:MAG: hypothetical protein LAT82_02075 [Nanoarchaeota archaeon]|nr:hypothetical protein [Nanoarchaeota archaeon]
MAIVKIDSNLIKKIYKIFKKESIEVFEFLKTLEQNPQKGKILFNSKKYQLKELKYKSFRFYFVKSNNTIIVFEENEIITFLDVSKKNDQQEVIDKLKRIMSKNSFDL